MKTLAFLVRSSIAGLTILVVAMFFARWIWILELPTNFRPQLLVVSIVLAVLAGIFSSRRDVAFGFIPAVLLAISIVPFYLSGPPQLADGADEFKVLQYNILHSNRNYDEIVNEVVASDADIVVMHEVAPHHWSAMGNDLLAEYDHMLFSPASVGGIHTDQIMLSRSPLELVDVETSYRNPPFAVRSVVHGEEILAVALHTHPSRTDREAIDDRQAEVAAAVAAVEQIDLPAIIVTDLNATATSPEYGQLLDDLGWNDPRSGLGIRPTWSFPSPVLGPVFAVAIDHVFASPEFTIHSYELGNKGGSDHKPLTATLSFS